MRRIKGPSYSRVQLLPELPEFMFSPPSTFGKLLRVAVLLLWQCPLPLIHTHSAAADSRQDPWLANHLRQFHADGADSGSRCTHGWHCHLLAPTGLPVSDPDDEGRGQARISFVASSSMELRAAAGGDSLTSIVAVVETDDSLTTGAFRAEAAWRSGEIRSVLDASRQQRATVLRC